MTYGAGGAAAAAAIAHAKAASGMVLKLEPVEFLKILSLRPAPLVAYSTSKFFGISHQYMTAYEGLVFHTKSKNSLPLPDQAVVILVKRMWMP